MQLICVFSFRFPKGRITYDQFKDLALTIGVGKINTYLNHATIFQIYNMFLSDHKTSPFINIFNTKVEEQDLDSFTKNIFKMFDVNNDRVLTFEEFTFATSAQNYDDPKEKLYWLFDNVYDKVNVIYENINCTLGVIYILKYI